MDKSLAELVKISNLVGKDPSLVLGGAGNTSVKTADGKYMYIKASGMALKGMTCKTGWRRLKVDSVLAILRDKSIAKMGVNEREPEVANALLAACDDKFRGPAHGGRRTTRPSIETCFHSMLDRFVIHLHPVAVLAYLCSQNGQAELKKLFKPEEFPPVWVPYTNIGYMLAKKIEKFICDYKSRYPKGPPLLSTTADKGVIFLQNHGLVVTADSSNTALRLVRKVVNICNSTLKQPKAVGIKPVSAEAITEAALAVRRVLFQTTGKYVTVRHFIDENIAGFLAGDDTAELCSTPAVTPDELVYAHGPAMWLDKWNGQAVVNKLNRRTANEQQLPTGFLIRPLGLFVAGSERQLPLIKDVISTYLSVRSFAAGLGGIRPLNKRRREFIVSQGSG